MTVEIFAIDVPPEVEVWALDAAPVTTVKELIGGPPGAQGEQGPKGDAGDGGEWTALAAAALSGHRAVAFDGAGGLVYASADDLTQLDALAGVTTGAAEAGADATVRSYGRLTEPSWSWTPLAPVWCGVDGVLTQTPPSGGQWARTVGIAETPTCLFVDLGEPIITT